MTWLNLNHDPFAIHTGQTGFWLRSFQGNIRPAGNPGPVDGKILQTVTATAGTQYTLSAWAKLQPAYSGLDPSSGTQTFLKMEFLDGSSAPDWCARQFGTQHVVVARG